MEKELYINDVLSHLSRNSEKYTAELALYTLLVNEGVPLGLGKGISYKIEELAATLGFCKRRMYYALKELSALGCISKMTVEDRDGVKKFLLISDKLECTPVQRDIDELVASRFEHHGDAKYADKLRASKPVHSAAPRCTPVQCTPVHSPNSISDNDLEISETEGESTYGSINTSNLSETHVNYQETHVNYLNTSNLYINTTREDNTREEPLSTDQHPRIESMTKETASGYWASQYAPNGSRFKSNPRAIGQKLVRWFFEEIYSRRGIDYYIPQGRLRKYYNRATDIQKLLGSPERTKQFVIWYMHSDSFQSAGWSLDLMVSSPVLNQFMSADPRELPTDTEYVKTVDEAKNLKGVIL